MFYQVMCDADTLIKMQTTISTLWTYSIIRFYVGKIWSVMKSHDLSFSTYSGKLRAVVWNKEIRLSLLVLDLRKQSSLNILDRWNWWGTWLRSGRIWGPYKIKQSSSWLLRPSIKKMRTFSFSHNSENQWSQTIDH